MKVRVYFCKEPDIQAVIIKQDKISRQALDTIYDLVWESEFKNILNVGRIWLKLLYFQTISSESVMKLLKFIFYLLQSIRKD